MTPIRLFLSCHSKVNRKVVQLYYTLQMFKHLSITFSFVSFNLESAKEINMEEHTAQDIYGTAQFEIGR